MNKLIVFIFLVCGMLFYNAVLAIDEPITETSLKEKVSSNKYSLDVTVKGIPKNQQTLFIPIMIDTKVLDIDKVGLEGLATQNILAVTSTSKEKVGPGIGLLKLDDEGLPEELTLKVLLKEIGSGKTDISLSKVADEPALPAKGAILDDQILVNVKTNNQIEVTEKIEDSKGKKRLILNEYKLTLDIQRTGQKEETIFIPLIFDKSVIDLDETFGHAIVAPGIAAKSFSSGSLHEGGPGVEIQISDAADKDFTVDVDLIPRKTGTSKLSYATPQRGHTALVRGPIVNINPSTINVVSKGN